MARLNQQEVRAAYDDFISGGVGSVIHLFADDIVWHIGGRNRLTGDYKGKYEVNRFFFDLMELTEGTFALEVDDVLGSDEHAVVLVRERARRNGTAHDMNGVHLWRLRDGQFTEFRRLPEDTYREDEFWS